MSLWKQWARRLFGREQVRKLTAEEKRRARRQARREAIAVILADVAGSLAYATQEGLPIVSASTPAELDAAVRRAREPLVFVPSGTAPPPLESLRSAAAQLSATRGDAAVSAPCGGLLWRRDALLQAGGLRQGLDAVRAELLRLGWSIPDAPGARAGESGNTATLFLSLSGREWMWPLTAAFLERQGFSHGEVELCVLDTSGDERFGTIVQQWLSGCDYAASRYLARDLGLRGLADQPRQDVLDPVRHAVAKIYNEFARQPSGGLAFFLEDDVIPPDDAYARLAPLVTGAVFSAAGVVRGRHERYRRGAPIVWRWNEHGEREDLAGGSGVGPVGGNGFGCGVLRGDVLRETVFLSGPPWDDFDFNFYYHNVALDRRGAVVDWDCACRHHDDPEHWI